MTAMSRSARIMPTAVLFALVFPQLACVEVPTEASPTESGGGPDGGAIWLLESPPAGDGPEGPVAAAPNSASTPTPVPVPTPGTPPGDGTQPPPQVLASEGCGEPQGDAAVAMPPLVVVPGRHDGGVPTPLLDAGVAEMPAEPAPPPLPVPGVGALVIAELMPDPTQRNDSEGEWVELWNATDRVLDVSDCALGDDADEGARLMVPELAADARLVVARSNMPGFVPDAVLSLSLRNQSDTVVVRCAGTVVDRVAYGPELGLPVTAGASLSLDPLRHTAEENDLASAWCLGTRDSGGDLGSPGEPNDACSGAQDAGMP